MNFSRKNTLKVNFPVGSIQPTDKEMVDFVLQYGLTGIELHSVYKDISDSCIYIKFHTREVMADFLSNSQSNITFNYLNGTIVKVSISDANIDCIYLRIFNLPPEIEDKDIIEALKKYGAIKSINKEKYPPSFGLDAFTGVRGAFLEMQHEVPNFIYVQRFRARIQYIGQKEICFLCKLHGHKKTDCPKNIKAKNLSNLNQATVKELNCNITTSHPFSVKSFTNSIKTSAIKDIENNSVDSSFTLLGRTSSVSRSISNTSNTSEQIKKPSIVNPELLCTNNEESLVINSSSKTFADFHRTSSPIKEKMNSPSNTVPDTQLLLSPVKISQNILKSEKGTSKSNSIRHSTRVVTQPKKKPT